MANFKYRIRIGETVRYKVNQPYRFKGPIKFKTWHERLPMVVLSYYSGDRVIVKRICDGEMWGTSAVRLEGVLKQTYGEVKSHDALT